MAPLGPLGPLGRESQRPCSYTHAKFHERPYGDPWAQDLATGLAISRLAWGGKKSNFFDFFLVPQMAKNCAPGPWGALGGIFRPFLGYFGAPRGNFFLGPWAPPGALFSLSWAAALWGAPPVHFTLVLEGEVAVGALVTSVFDALQAAHAAPSCTKSAPGVHLIGGIIR